MPASSHSEGRSRGLSGVSFDWERKGENKKSHHSYLVVTSALRAALNPVGARVTSFSNNFYHDMRHPIRSATPAECLPPALVEAMQTALRSTRADIKLSQQYWVRTDYRPPPYNDHPGMHLDHACLPWQREATPSQHYYLCQVALCDIPPGGAATLVSPAAFRRAKATAAQLQHEEPEWCAALDDEQFRTTLTGKVGEQPEHDELVEVVRRPTTAFTRHGFLSAVLTRA